MIRLAIVLSLWSAAALAAEPQPVFACEPVKVLDGDTLDCRGGPRVRLWAVQAPERGEPGWREAKQTLALLVEGIPLTCEPMGKSRGRTVALCRGIVADTLPMIDIGDVMVRAGLAAACPRYGARYIGADTGRVPRPAWCAALAR